ncbi:MAG: polyphosphate:AMP phosphotransferase [Calditrichaeota bacterium]|nr:MAG: polyphosphate:AMP phosphotransferase [Calditrichota bacterium]
MLENFEFLQVISKKDYKSQMTGLKTKLGELQRELQKNNIPLNIVFEGFDTAGKGTIINNLMLNLDPRGFNAHFIKPPTEEEYYRPFMWRFWNKIAAQGRIAIFNKSWYQSVTEEKVELEYSTSMVEKAFENIISFEEKLLTDKSIILKFFIHITKDEQKRRLKKLESNSYTSWKVGKDEWKKHKLYNQYKKSYEEMLDKTSTDLSPWHIIEGHDKRFATLKVFKTIIETIEQSIESFQIKPQPIRLMKVPFSMLDKVDLDVALEREEYEKELKFYQKKIRGLEHDLYRKRRSAVILYEGWDAAGKGGNIKRLVNSMDPRGYEVIPIAAPNDIEKKHHYLWRFWSKIPKAGHIAIFDRTWYGRVLVERVEGFCTTNEWKRAYNEINGFEKNLANFGTIVIKFWIHISQEEQLARFKARQENPYKQWKITDEDWRNRERFVDYKKAVDEMLFRTNTKYAPWTIVEGNSKLYARIKVLKTVASVFEEKLNE